jgi:hypothetical protein
LASAWEELSILSAGAAEGELTMFGIKDVQLVVMEKQQL